MLTDDSTQERELHPATISKPITGEEWALRLTKHSMQCFSINEIYALLLCMQRLRWSVISMFSNLATCDCRATGALHGLHGADVVDVKSVDRTSMVRRSHQEGDAVMETSLGHQAATA